MFTSTDTSRISRRRFLKNTGALLAAGTAFPMLVPARALGLDGEVAPSNRITVGVVGTRQGMSSIRSILPFADAQVVGACDVDSRRAVESAALINRHYQSTVAKPYGDYRELFAKAKLDAVVLAAPDHWHGIMAVTAARAGIDIYGEKPLAHTFAEGRAIVDAVKQHGRVWQTGSWQRSIAKFREAVELVRGGCIGKVSRVEVGTIGDFNSYKVRSAGGSPGRPPEHLDYEMWLGPALWRPYDPRITHYNWRWSLDFGGGNLMDWVGHHVDIAHWALNLDHTGPVKVRGISATYSEAPSWDAERTYTYECTYASGQVITVGGDIAPGAKFFGEDGKWLYVDRGKFEVSDPAILRQPGEPVYRSDNHWRNFIDCVKTRATTITPADVAHRSATVGHLGHIALMTGRTLHWDPETETIKDDPGATALLRPVYRSPWAL
ncbi:MAG: Gfo/Idh/MocA family oxidoreductase [Puniceicoccales bacterium]|jgi:predicted dehydrogenase|nr:Gfo/Idh/MocA family oxidoreductase [Puniceicoccales bacterium]